MDTQGFKTVAVFTDPTTAQIVSARLRDNGIPSAVLGTDSSYPSLSFAQSRVVVNEDDYEEAVRILAASDSAE